MGGVKQMGADFDDLDDRGRSGGATLMPLLWSSCSAGLFHIS
jgi:hypothetical protein